MTGCSSSKESLELHEDTEILKDAGLENLDNPDNQITVLPKGTKVVVLNKEYGKDYLAYKVETSDGLKGYIIHSSKMTLTNQE